MVHGLEKLASLIAPGIREMALKDVNVALYKGTTLIATTKTDALGEYYFSSKSKIKNGSWSGSGADTTLLPETDYKIVFGRGNNQTSANGDTLTVSGQGKFLLTQKDATASNGNDQNDSDASKQSVAGGSYAAIGITTGTVGSVNHTYDAGFYCVESTVTIAQVAATCTGTVGNNDGKIQLTTSALPYDKFRVKTGAGAFTGDSTYATASAIGSTFPKDLKTAIPNAGATYKIRFYLGECCYKDTTITVAPVICAAAPLGAIGDFVFADTNKDGKQDAGEAGVNGVKVYLLNAAGARIDSTTTAGGGKYLFPNLPAGTYSVEFNKATISAIYSGFTAKDSTAAGTTDANDSDADLVTGKTAQVTLVPVLNPANAADSAATFNYTLDAGLILRANDDKTYDLALDKSIDKKLAMLGETVNYTIRVWNEGQGNATGVEVTDPLNAGVEYVTHATAAGNYNPATKIWTIGNLAVGDTVTLTVAVKVVSQGVWFNTAEITKMNEKDEDSTPGNNKDGEDDIDRECFTVPIQLCRGQGTSVELMVPAPYTGIVWFRKTQNGQPVQVATGNTFIATETELGSYEYTFTSSSGTCPAEGCCPTVIVVEDCCPVDVCVPFTITKKKK